MSCDGNVLKLSKTSCMYMFLFNYRAFPATLNFWEL